MTVPSSKTNLYISLDGWLNTIRMLLFVGVYKARNGFFVCLKKKTINVYRLRSETAAVDEEKLQFVSTLTLSLIFS